MTVQELIIQLEKVPENYEVLLYESSEDDSNDEYTYFGSVLDHIEVAVRDDETLEPIVVLSPINDIEDEEDVWLDEEL